MGTTAEGIRTMPTPLWLTPMQDRLLINAELVVIEDYCQNGCIHHRPVTPCFACPEFIVPKDGYICCDGYEQGEEGAA